MFRKICLLLFLLLSVMQGVLAQEMTVKSFELLSNDIIARTSPRNDRNGIPCAVIRVGIALQGVVFDGNTIGAPVYNTGEYLVYVPEGSRQITIRHNSYVPLTVAFADYGIDRVKSSTTYRLTVLKGGVTPSSQQPEGNFLVMNVTPATARVSIDNGESRPVNANGTLKVYLQNGSHSYRVEADGYLDNNGSVSMAGSRQQVSVTLQSTKASLTVKTTTSGSKIYIDEEYKGKDSWQGELTPGTYFVEARKDGFRSSTKTVTLAKQQTESITFPALQQIFGSMMVDYEPVDAEVYLDNNLIGKSPNVFNNLATGKHSIKISKDGYSDYTGSVTIQENQQASVSGSLTKNSVVSSSPSSTSGTLVPITVNGVTFNMIKVDGGTFTMGATSEQKNPDNDEKPTHQVTLSSYYIGETEVTQALWKAVMGNNPSYFKGDNLPVEKVSWEDCQTFIGKLNDLTGKRFRLPTEAEWEYAARGGKRNNHTQYSGGSMIDDVARYRGNSGSKTHSVKTKKPNELGLYDMSGNVYEWCQDRYGSYGSNAQTNPTGPDSGSDRVNRGGGWFSGERGCRSSCRFTNSPGFRYNDLGLRLALSE